MVRNTFLALTFLLAAFVPASNAAIVTVLDSGSATVSALLDSSDFSIEATDFRAGAVLGVVDTSTATVLSLVFATDAAAPAPNNVYSVLNGTFTELGFLTFDTTTASIVGNTFTANATFSGGPFTDAGLSALLGEHVATFTLFQAAPVGDQIVATYNFESLVKVEDVGEIPEPGTFLLLGCGAAAVGIFRRRLA